MTQGDLMLFPTGLPGWGLDATKNWLSALKT